MSRPSPPGSAPTANTAKSARLEGRDEVIIRLAKPDELKDVQDLNYELFVSDQKHLGDLNVDWPYETVGENYFRSLIAGKGGVCFVAELDGKVVGYLAGGLQKKHEAYVGKRAELENMCVTAEVRSAGIGGQLVQAFYDWCKGQRVDYVMVNAFSPNTRALAFYTKQGFTDYSTTLWHKL